MRITAITLSLLCSTASAQVWEPTDNGNLLWQKEQQNQIKLVPSQITPTPIEGLSVYSDVDRGTYGTVNRIGEGQYLINQDGPNTSELTIVNRKQDGGYIWR